MWHSFTNLCREKIKWENKRTCEMFSLFNRVRLTFSWLSENTFYVVLTNSGKRQSDIWMGGTMIIIVFENI